MDQSELISIAGLLGTPAPGLMYHLINESEQQSLLGISYDTKSFVLIGECLPTGIDLSATISTLKEELEERDLTQSSLLEETARLQGLELKWIAVAAPGLLTNSSGSASAIEDALKPLTAESKGALLDSIHSDINIAKSRVELLRAALVSHAKAIRKLSAHPGIIVARWQGTTAGNVSVEAVPFAGLRASRESELGGYVILGGVRVVVPFFSMDASTMFLDIEEASPGSIANLKHAGVTTYLLQAKELAYTNSTSLQTYLGLRGSIDASTLAGSARFLVNLQRVAFDVAFSSSQQNVSGGRIGNFQWRRVDLNFSDRWNVPQGPQAAHIALGLRDKAQNDLLEIGGATANVAPSSDGEWITVIAQLMSFSAASRFKLSLADWAGYLPKGNVQVIEREAKGAESPALVRESQLSPKTKP